MEKFVTSLSHIDQVSCLAFATFLWVVCKFMNRLPGLIFQWVITIYVAIGGALFLIEWYRQIFY